MKLVLFTLAILTAFSAPVQSHHRTAKAAKKLLPSVVYILVTTPGVKGWYTGSGVIIHESGLFVTNAHIAARGTKYRVRLANAKVYSAKFIGLDWSRDIALLKIEAPRKFKAAKLGRSSTVAVGHSVIVIGSPYGLAYSVTKGIVSALHRNIYVAGLKFKNLIQTDAAVNPGNSGGPMANLKGEVIGIVMATHRSGEALGFVIPISTVRETVARILKNPKQYPNVQSPASPVLESKAPPLRPRPKTPPPQSRPRP